MGPKISVNNFCSHVLSEKMWPMKDHASDNCKTTGLS